MKKVNACIFKPDRRLKIIWFPGIRIFKIFPLIFFLLLVSAKNWAQPVAVAGNSGPVCIGSDVNLFESGGNAVSWAWSSDASATFNSASSQNPVASGVVNGEIFTVVITDIDGNTASSTTTVIVNALPIVTLPAAGPVCIDGSPIQLSGTPANGSYSGTGVSSTGLFNPLTAGAGNHVITYSYTDGNSCINTATTTITVNALPVVTLPDASPLCINAFPVQLTGTPAGGSYSGNGVSLSGLFTPSIAGAGNHIITYSFTDGNSCTNRATTTITVNPLPVSSLSSSDADNIICVGTGVIFTAGGGIDYNFRLGGVSVQSGTSATYSTNSLINGQVVDVIVTDSKGCKSTSSGITNFVNQVPFILITNSPACSPDLTTYSLSVTTNSGIVTSTSGTVTNTGINVWTISNVLSGTNIVVKVTDSNGCESSIGVTAPNCLCPVVPVPVSDGNKSFCEAGVIPALNVTTSAGTVVDWYNSSIGGTLLKANSLTYTPTVAGTYYASARNTISNCVSSTRTPVTLTMNALPTPTLTSSDADNTFCTGTSVTFTAGGGTNFNFRIGGTSVQNSASATYTTSSLLNGQVVDVFVTNSSGCTATSAAKVNTVNPYPVANAGTTGNSCNLLFNLKAVPSIGVGTWSKISGPGTVTFSPNTNSANATVTVSVNGTYTFKWKEVSFSCSDSSIVSVNFNIQPVANAGTGGNNCGNQFFLNAVPSIGVGTWTKVSGPGNSTFSPNANDPHANVTVSAFGQYKFNWTEVNGTCSSTSSVNVNFLQIPAANAGNDGSECDLDYMLNAVPELVGGIGTWSKLSGPGNAIFSPDHNKSDAKVTVDKFGTYEFLWTEIISTCQSSDKISVVFHNLPVISAGRDTIICENGSVQLHATGTGSYLWAPASFLNNPVIASPVATPDTTTVFKLTITDGFGCKNSDEIRVQVWNNPKADAGPDQSLNYLFGTTLAAVLPGENEKGAWTLTFGSGKIADTTYAKTSVSKLSVGENTFLWTLSNGVCQPSDDYITIRITDLEIPSLITPNMDGKNDLFILKGLETLGKSELVIFDRRGVQVYRNMDYHNTWDGVSYNGSPLPDDTYFYVLKSDNGKSLSGFIVIRR